MWSLEVGTQDSAEEQGLLEETAGLVSPEVLVPFFRSSVKGDNDTRLACHVIVTVK